MKQEKYSEKIAELDAKARQDQLKEQDEAEKRAQEEAKKNTDFFMIFKKSGSPLIRDLIGESPIGARLFMFLAEESDRTNAIVASGKALAAALQVSEASISRAIKTLKEKKLIEVLNSGGSNVFVLNPDVVWSAWKTGKTACLFGNAKVLMSTSEQSPPMKKRLNVLLNQQTLFNESEGEGQQEPPKA
jgi:hypothetical protein